jgi:vancomycin resistance protein VanJ
MAGLAVVLVGVVWGVQELWGESHRFSAIVTYAPPVLYLSLPAVALAIAVFAWDRRATAWALLAAGLCSVGVARPSIPVSHRRAPVERTLRVVTWNIHDRLDRLPELRETIGRLNPDILCLQEANARRFEEVMPGARRVRTHSTLILTHGDIRSRRIIRLGEPGQPLRAPLEADIVLDGMRLKVLNVHLYSLQLASALKHPPSAESEQLAEDVFAVRDTQVDAVLEWLEAQDGPALVAGDFNTPPRGHVYRRLADAATDAFAAAGQGYGWTFPSHAPVLRIDYVWLNRDLTAVGCYRLRGGPSDHCPVVADIAVR